VGGGHVRRVFDAVGDAKKKVGESDLKSPCGFEGAVLRARMCDWFPEVNAGGILRRWGETARDEIQPKWTSRAGR
jgi:hypothetical protein